VTKRTPNTFLVGAGPVATALAGGLRFAGVPVLGLWARNGAAARAASAAAGVAGFSAAPPDLLLEADVVILAVRDDAVAQVARTLVTSGLVNRHHVLLHCSGAVSAAEAFGAVGAEVGGIGTLHPLRAIPDGRAAMRSLDGTVFGVEGDDAGRLAAASLAVKLGGRVLELDGPKMAAYHTAASMASNFLVVLIDLAAEMFGEAGAEPAKAIDALMPLIETTLANVRERGTAAALTGPIRRGDAGTIARHLDLLVGRPELLAVYRALGRHAIELARRAGTAEPALGEIARLLADAPSRPVGGRASAST
jgi:predicted short-subunit dehydrogenase-like oxidoreductase (DUF2520 family)